MIRAVLILVLGLVCSNSYWAKSIEVRPNQGAKAIVDAIISAEPYDSLYLRRGEYLEHDILIDKPLSILGEEGVVIDARHEGYGLIIKSDSVQLKNIGIQNIGRSYTKDYAAIYVSHSKHFLIEDMELSAVFFGMLIEKSHHGVIRGNQVSSNAIEEAGSGNGIHIWHCSNMRVEDNETSHLRDGIYFEFVSESSVENNHSHDNIRYGLHFMFSNNDEYHFNRFANNGAGVAVMFSKFIDMSGNTFIENWGSASYGLLLKEIYDARIENNVFENNTIGIFAEGATRIEYRGNDFKSNGWALKVSGACYTNRFVDNNFLYNTFDVSYNSKMNDNLFEQNYWSAYAGYDLDEDGVGDVPFRPVKLFSYVVNRTPESIVLLRSLFVDLLDFSEKVSPVFTPDELMDERPRMKRFQ